MDDDKKNEIIHILVQILHKLCKSFFYPYLGSHGTLLGVINAFVHVIMYRYVSFIFFFICISILISNYM